VSNAAGWQLLESAREPDLLVEAVQKLVLQWGYVFDERLMPGSTIGSLGTLARRRPEILPEVVPQLGAAMEIVVIAALEVASVSADQPRSSAPPSCLRTRYARPTLRPRPRRPGILPGISVSSRQLLQELSIAV
jgi:hypothetical protein